MPSLPLVLLVLPILRIPFLVLVLWFSGSFVCFPFLPSFLQFLPFILILCSYVLLVCYWFLRFLGSLVLAAFLPYCADAYVVDMTVV